MRNVKVFVLYFNKDKNMLQFRERGVSFFHKLDKKADQQNYYKIEPTDYMKVLHGLHDHPQFQLVTYSFKTARSGKSLISYITNKVTKV